MKKCCIIILSILMTVGTIIGIQFSDKVFAETSNKFTVESNAMSLGGNGNPKHGTLWGYSSEDPMALVNGPTNCIPGKKNAVIIEMTMPVDGEVSFADKGTFVKFGAGSEKSDGARARLILNNTQIYPANEEWANLNPGDTLCLLPEKQSAKAGDKLNLVIDCGVNGDNQYDSMVFCLGIKLNNKWCDSKTLFYNKVEDGEAMVDFAGKQVKKSEAISFRYGKVVEYVESDSTDLGAVTTEPLNTISGMDGEDIVYDATNKWVGREKFCWIWKEASGLKVHTGAIYNPSIGYEFAQEGKAQLQNIVIKSDSNQSDGQRFRVIKVSADNKNAGQQVYPLDKVWHVVTPETVMEEVNTVVVPVKAGDILILSINMNETQSYDQTDIKFNVAFQENGKKTVIANAVEEFTGTNESAWKYMDYVFPASYENVKVGEVEPQEYVSLDAKKILMEKMTYFSSKFKWGIVGQNFLQIDSSSLHPNSVYGAVIGIKMPSKGRVDLSDTEIKYDYHATADSNGHLSDGIRVRILKNNTVVYPLDGNWLEIKDGDKHSYDIPIFEVNKDDMIYFIVDCGADGKMNYDLTYATIVAHFAEDGSEYTTTFNSKDDFLETAKNHGAYSYYSYFYDENAGEEVDPSNPEQPENPKKPEQPENPDQSKEDDVVIGEKKGCGGNLSGTAALLGTVLVCAAVVVVRRKRTN